MSAGYIVTSAERMRDASQEVAESLADSTGMPTPQQNANAKMRRVQWGKNMVFCRCPNCGESYHISPAMDVREWYEKFVPDLKPGEEPILECFGCWKPLAEGHVVRPIEKPSDADSDRDEGVVIAVDKSNPDQFVVEFEDRQTKLFKRLELHFRGEITELAKDQCDLLADATEDWFGIYEAKAILQDLKRARSAIESLFDKDFISIWWYETWAGGGPPKKFEGKDARNAMNELNSNDQWWDAAEYMDKGYYAFTATEKGKQYHFTNPIVKYYMCNEWHQRAFARGQISEDLFRKNGGT